MSNECYIGVDVGGTHTDVAVACDGRVVRGKALSTYDDFSRGVLEAVGVAAGELGTSLESLLNCADHLVAGTTVVTNAITQLRGSRVGVLITAGFKDTLHFAGGVRKAEFDDHLQVMPPELVARRDLAEIHERVNWAGEVVIPLDLNEVQQKASQLVDDGVEAIAVCFLSSFANPKHELDAERAIASLYPGLFVVPSHRVLPIAGETRRFTTAALTAFVHGGAAAFLDSLNAAVRSAGLGGGFFYLQGVGGSISLEKAKSSPLNLLGSGPAGGAIGANDLAKHLGQKRVLLGDMGGTSFDTGVIVDNDVRINRNLDIGTFRTGVNVVDVVSVGAGGGSIAWISERGVPQVGPHSAGSTPGPAALNRGGEEPTVTDAMVATNFIDPDGYLGGRIKLLPDRARAALDRVFGRFGWSTDEAAAAVYDLVVVNMANAVREVSMDKGHDPREFLFLAYGGMLPMFAAPIAERLGIETIVIPENSSVFCALGLLSADHVLRTDHAVGWDLTSPDGVERTNAVFERMVRETRAEMEAEGVSASELAIERAADFRFQGQYFELPMSLPERPLTAEDAPRLAQEFFREYEQTYGEGTAWRGVPTSLVNGSVTVTAHRPRVTTRPAAVTSSSAAQPGRHREVFLPSERRRQDVAIYTDDAVAPGASVLGPAIVEAADTTIYVPPKASLRRDEHFNYILERKELS